MRVRLLCAVLLVVAVAGGSSGPQSVGAAVGAPSPVTVGQARLSDSLRRDLTTLPAETPYGFFAHFRGGTPTDWRAALEGAGFEVLSIYETVHAAFAYGAIGDLRALSHDPLISYLQDNREIRLLDETAPWATRVRVAQEAVASGPYRDTTGRILDGSGVGVAIVDSGADSGHPDLVNRIVTDYKVECSFILAYTASGRCFPDPIALPKGVPSDTTSGHGTHVAGIVAGDGTASKGFFKGAAPGASLFTFGVGEGRNVFFTAQAYEFIVQEYASFTPRIRVINNSWGDPEGSVYDPEDIMSKLVRAAGELGVTSVFAAGNDGDANSSTGTADTGQDDDLSSYAKDPTPGVITVANYYDNQTGTRDHTLSDSSSRGRKGDAANYPDISAPGQFITSTCTFRLPICATGLLPETRWSPHYNHLSGTSMAAPHVAGVAALLYQARPELTPAQVEDVLQDTAYKFTGGVLAPGAYEPDPQNLGSTIAFDKGAGIVDVPAALDALGVAHDRMRPPAPPAINLTEPAEGADADGLTVVRGTAFDGTPPPATLETVPIAAGDGGDFSGPKAADIVAVSATEQAGGMSYAIQVANLADLPLTGTVSFRLFQRLNTVNRTSEVTLRSTGVSYPGPSATHNAAPTTVSRDLATNTVRMFVPFANLGDAPAGSIATEVWAASYVGVFTDAAPGRLAAEGVAQPERGRPYSIVRPAPVRPVQTVGVLLSVDGGTRAFTTMGGASPTWTWTGAVDLTTVPGGVHRIDAVLQVDGVDAALDTVSVTVPTLVYDVEIATPADGDVVLLAPTTVAGTATASRATSAAQSVTVQVRGPAYDSGEHLVSGVSSWSDLVDFGLLRPGAYTVTARQYADALVVDTDTISVTVPEPTPGDQISYAPQGAGWWKQQLAGGARFTTVELDRIKGRAVQLSKGWFDSPDALTAAATASGRQSAEARASRQLGVLLLNLSAGDLSRSMSTAVGLSGAERLSAAVYDRALVGTDVDAATAWVRAQLPSGDLAGATAVATSINGGIGLE